VPRRSGTGGISGWSNGGGKRRRRRRGKRRRRSWGGRKRRRGDKRRRRRGKILCWKMMRLRARTSPTRDSLTNFAGCRRRLASRKGGRERALAPKEWSHTAVTGRQLEACAAGIHGASATAP